jgi:serine/threonine protein kinase/Flp pilus assembly protein TadD
MTPSDADLHDHPTVTAPPPASGSDLDDPRVLRAVEEYAELLHGGERPDREAFLARHPDIADALARCLDGLEFVHAAGHDLSRPGTGPADGADLLLSGVPLGDFRLIREVGRGGMGIVYEAEQLSLGRRVALKVLPYAATMDAKHLQRFKNEARAAASLHHEHIVPVYGVGCERGVHFYAMQLIDGVSLAQMLPSLHAPAGAAADAPTVPVAALSTEPGRRKGREFYRAVARLIADAADALEHAHQLGIVHRDVKPGNLIVDESGKVWVADFGLARFGTDAGLTMSGDLLGTLRYMAPEQALAKHGLVDHRADVYGLGATFYELLTGRPAVGGDSREEILRRIAFDEPAPARRLDKAIPAVLETVTLKCLAKNPNERYATAGELADDLRRWLSGQSIRARRLTVQQRLARWGRRHPGLTAVMGLAAGLLLAGAWAWDREKTQADTAARTVAAEADQLREADRLPEALAVAQRAADLLPRFGGDAALRREIEQRVADLQLLNRLEEARMEGADVRPDGSGFDVQRMAQLFRLAFSEYGVDLISGDEEAVVQALRRPAVSPQVIAVLTELRSNVPNATEIPRLGRLVEALDADARRLASRLFRAAQGNDVKALKQLAAETNPELTQPPLLAELGTELEAASLFVDAERLLRAGQRHYPGDFWINHGLASVLDKLGPHRAADAIRYFGAAVALRPRSAGAWINLGRLFQTTRRYEEATAAYRRAIALKPDYWAAHGNLGDTLVAQGRVAEAESHFRRALELRPDDAQLVAEIGSALLKAGRRADAEEMCRRALEMKPEDADANYALSYLLCRLGRDSDSEVVARRLIRLKPNFAEAHVNLGHALMGLGRHAEAEAEFRKAIELKPSLPHPHTNLGNIYKDRGRYRDAEAAYRRAIALDPKDWETHHNLSMLLFYHWDKRVDAEAVARRLIALKPEMAEAHALLGDVLSNLGRWADAEASWRRAIKLQHDLAVTHCNLGTALQRRGLFREAVAEHRLGHELGSKRKDWSQPSVQWVRDAERMADLASRLPSLLAKESHPADADEAVLVARVCAATKHHVAAARFYAAAFASKPQLADERSYRYDAACAATLAGCGQGNDADKLDDAERAKLRRQALEWSRAEYAAFIKVGDTLPNGTTARESLKLWQREPGFAGVRDIPALAKLPDDEIGAWVKLWADIAELLRRLE